MKHLLLALVGLLSLASCARKTYWTGFHGPAYLPNSPGESPAHAARRTAEVRRLDSLTASKWRIPPCQERPLVPRPKK
ncbi:MAG: hypothetical protein ACRYFZ_24410 [Janthinobacterium lividum]